MRDCSPRRGQHNCSYAVAIAVAAVLLGLEKVSVLKLWVQQQS